MTERRSDLDALRSFAMALGIAVHASLAFYQAPWPVHDTRPSGLLPLVFLAIHGFRMPLFFLLSGYFTMLVYRRRGLGSLLRQRFARIVVPLVLAMATIGPLDGALQRHAIRSNQADPAIAEMFAGDADAVRRRFAAGADAEGRDALFRRRMLSWAACSNHPAVVAAVLDAGGDVNARGGLGDTTLHEAVAFGRDEAAAALLDVGADPRIANRSGRTPLAMTLLSPELAAEYAPLLGLPPLDADEIARGRGRIRAMLGDDEMTVGGPLDRVVLAYWQWLGSDRFRLRFGGRPLHLVDTNLFDHLWFLWFLCWLVGAFATVAAMNLLPSGRHRWWFVPLSLVPQLFMGQSMSGFFGPDTSFGLLPMPHLLVFYGCFYFFGAATFAAEGMETRLGARWPLLLPAALVLFVVGVVTIGVRPAAAVLQPAYAWAMSLGLIGLFHRVFAHPSARVAWLADAAYWMYLAHVPLVIAAQIAVRDWPLPGIVKFLLILAAVTTVLLVSYAWCIRPTILGRILNGPRTAAKR
ncbi:MAG: acyltransferase family protein [Planctomycetia bacterium]